MKAIYFLYVATLAFMATSCSTISTTTDYDRNVDFSSIKTFSLHEDGFKTLKVNDLDKSRIRESLIQNFTIKGITHVTNDSDVIVNVSVFNKDKVDVNYNNYGWGFRYGYGGFGLNWSINFPNVNQYKEGSMVIDVVDTKKNTLIWQGIARGILVEKLEKKQEQINEAIQKVVAKFPPKK